MLQNLLADALKVTSKRQDARVEFGVVERDGRTTYVVRDNGAGFDMEHVGKLYGAFRRLHAREEFPGTGVGLATTQCIVHRHGGTIWAESVDAAGSAGALARAADAALDAQRRGRKKQLGE